MKTIQLSLLSLGLCLSGCTSPLSVNAASPAYPIEKSQFHYAPVAPEKTASFVGDVYFSRNYFEHPSTEYDPHLASASSCMVISSFTDFGPFDEDWYLNQSKFVKEYFEAIGFTGFTINEDYQKSATFDSIGLAAAKHEFGDYTVVAITPRSGGYFREWGNNMHLGDGSKSDMMHEGWYNAANKLLTFLDGYVSEQNIQGKVKLWMTGFSRGGATTNIAAGLIDNKLSKGEKIFSNGAQTSREDVYAYTFEAPQGANVNSKNVKAPKDALYDNIFNIVNPLDIVPKLAMKQYGFTRFGRDKYVRTAFYDPRGYDEYARTYRALLDIINQNQDVTVNHCDEFTMGGFDVKYLGGDLITFIAGNIFSDKELVDYVKKNKDKTKANYDANIAASILIEELVKNIGDRSHYVASYQTSLESVMLLIQNEANPVSMPFSKLAKTFFTALISKALGNDSKAKSKIAEGWGQDIGEELDRLVSALASPLLDVYWERPNELFSLAGYAPYILQNHYPDFVFAHLASQDSYYVDAYNEGKDAADQIVLGSFMDNADYGRMKFFGYNDIGLRLDSQKGNRVINIEGHYAGKSDILDCKKGYAAAYYSYATEEKMELFMPVGCTYNISMKSYSKKPYHRCEYWAYYEYFSLDNSGKVQVEKDHKKESVCFASDRHKRDVVISR
ncbi:MAG: hypothetical protein IJU64_07320 [Bacilli bacterium]|nr:hypothetical protein [Bacilli bacterium]